jgi:hypothetical protein
MKEAKTSVPPQPDWILKSDQFAEKFTKALASIHPEVGSQIGYSEFDKKGLLWEEDLDEKEKAFFTEWQKNSESEMTNTKDLELKTDHQVFQIWLKNQIETIETSKKEHEVFFGEGNRFVYQSLQAISNSQSSPERKSAAVDRFKIYVHGDKEHKPFLEAMQEAFITRLQKYKGAHPLLPYRGQVEQYQKDSTALLSGVEEMLKDSGRSDWAEDWELYKKQSAAFDEFTKNQVLPNSRISPRLPEAVYIQTLRQRGIESTPAQLISTGLADYKKLYKEFESQARVVAKLHRLSDVHPAAVIKFLKSKPVAGTKEVENLYKTADLRLAKILSDHQIISVPQAPLKIRMAGEAESKAVPVPHLLPPPLINNKGARPEFVVPSAANGAPFDDFSSPYSAMILTAHEGRPGHDMQFSQMLDHGLSVIRSRYAANNVNIEGWALYAEDIVFPYFGPEEKLFALQTRLWRMARMFLDPQLQLGKIKDQRVLEVFTKELGVSEAMANLELRRYKFEDIGQAPSYYEGYKLVKKMRNESEKTLAADFNQKCFNDRLLSFGLLPLKIASQRMSAEPKCVPASERRL